MAAFRAVVLLSLAAAAGCLQVEEEEGARSSKGSDNVGMYNLTICNAYADSRPLNAYTLASKAKLTEEPVGYKTCKRLTLELADGERVDFRLGGLSVGTFHATRLPYTAASLLLVPYHRGNGTMSASFASHAFPASVEQSPQIAVVDTYSGSSQNTIGIQVGASKRAAEGALLRAGTAATLAAGRYEVVLRDATGRRGKAAALDAVSGGMYAVIRLGSDESGLEEDIIVAPMSGDLDATRSGTLRVIPSVLAAVPAALAAAAAALAC
mmetsp:Transcript_100863/g.262943  ORF Transcript_100863/g.262943 Transcript_100863/m.262943 type:complete len:267 (+) Transcript_100863:62-862(+)